MADHYSFSPKQGGKGCSCFWAISNPNSNGQASNFGIFYRTKPSRNSLDVCAGNVSATSTFGLDPCLDPLMRGYSDYGSLVCCGIGNSRGEPCHFASALWG